MAYFKGRRARVAAFVAFIGTSSAVLAAPSLQVQATQLLQADNGKAAYALLEPQEMAFAGDIELDLLFAQAALAVGQNTRAVFALERILAQRPEHARARAEIARAYLALGETANARAEFNAVKAQGVPESVARTIDHYLAAVDRIEADARTNVRGYVEATLGYDSNVNVAPNKSEVAIPGFGGLPFTLDNKSRAAADWFGSLGAGVNLRTPLNRRWSVVGGLSGTQRWNQHRGEFDMLSGDASLGVLHSRERDIYSFNLQGGSTVVDSARYRETTGFSAQWQRNLDARNQVSLFLQYADMRYISQPIRNAERWVVGGGYGHAFRSGSVAYGSAYLLKEEPRSQGTASHLSLEGVGMRIGGQLPYSEQTSLFANASIEWRWHKGIDASFLLARSDQQSSIGAGVVHELRRDLRVTGQYTWTDNRSNIELNQYRRDMVSLTVRQDF